MEMQMETKLEKRERVIKVAAIISTAAVLGLGFWIKSKRKDWTPKKEAISRRDECKEEILFI